MNDNFGPQNHKHTHTTSSASFFQVLDKAATLSSLQSWPLSERTGQFAWECCAGTAKQAKPRRSALAVGELFGGWVVICHPPPPLDGDFDSCIPRSVGSATGRCFFSTLVVPSALFILPRHLIPHMSLFLFPRSSACCWWGENTPPPPLLAIFKLFILD